MYCIDVLLDEHERIREFISVAQSACCRIIEGEQINTEHFAKMLEFGKGYADSIHHKKEEDILFDAMVNEFGGPAEKMIRHGMLVEHDLGRLHLSELDNALNEYISSPSVMLKLRIITNISAYCELLERHIVKENEVAYPFGQRVLSNDTFNRLNDETEKFESDSDNATQKKYYLDILDSLKKEYC